VRADVKDARSGRLSDAYLGEAGSGYFELGYLKNVIIMTSCEDQKTADKRIPHLMRCRAARRGVSLEPLIGEIDMGPYTPGMWHCQVCGHWMKNRYAAVDEGESSPLCGKCNSLNVQMVYLHWAIVGDESGPGRRKSQQKWHRSILYHCDGSGVAFFDKQIEVKGEITGDISKFPEDLRVRQFPKLEDAK
jgi:protein gp37